MQFYSGKTSLVSSGGVTITEEYIPLWFADGTSVGFGSGALSAGQWFIVDGYNYAANSTATNARLHTLNSNWSSNQKFALEVTLYSASASYSSYASIWDFTSGTQISSSQVSTTSTTATVLRSSQFSLTPGHVIGVSFWNSNSSNTTYAVDASLIVFG